MGRKITETYKEAQRIRVAERRRQVKLECIAYKGGACSVCNYNKCAAALTFHHIYPNEKEFGIADGGRTRGFEKLKPELDKCLLLCHNCHAEMHAKEDEEKRQQRLQRFETMKTIHR